MLERARPRSGLSHSELWFRYFDLGGMSTMLELKAHLCEALTPTRHDLALVTTALEPFSEARDEHPARVPRRRQAGWTT